MKRKTKQTAPTKPKPIPYESLTGDQLRRLEMSGTVRELRAHLGQSQQAFGSSLQPPVAIRSIANYEAGLRIPEAPILLQFARAAIESGRPDIAHELLEGLELEKILGGPIRTWKPETKRGFLLVPVGGDRDDRWATAFFRSIQGAQAAGDGKDAERRAKFERALNAFAEQVEKVPGRKPDTDVWRGKK